MTSAASPEHDGVLGLDDTGRLELVLDDAGGLELLVVGDLLRSVKIPAVTAASTAANTAPIAPMAGPESLDLDEFPADSPVTSFLSFSTVLPSDCEPAELPSAGVPGDGGSSGMYSWFPA